MGADSSSDMTFSALALPLAQLSLAAVLKCGQSFRWSIITLPTLDLPKHTATPPPTHEYRLCLRDRVVCLRQDPNTLWYRAAFPTPAQTKEDEDKRATETLAWIKDYFQLDVDLVDLYDDWSRRDPVFNKLRDRFQGIRILRQDPWENLVSFICSSNNHISRITSMVSKLCNHYSPSLLALPTPSSPSTEASTYHPFPPPSVLADTTVSTTLRSLGFGYRADFIQKTAQMLVEAHGTTPLKDKLEPSEEFLYTLRDVSTSEARTELLRFMGVGPKVADCILLMSLDKREVIPVDTHVHQIAAKHYGIKGKGGGKGGAKRPYDEVNEKLAAIWGPYAGWAHSVLFTADLKSFASYGLDTPGSSPTKPDPAIEKAANDIHNMALNTPPSTKRKRNQFQRTLSESDVHAKDELPQLTVKLEEAEILDEGLTMAERIKRRKRIPFSRSMTKS